jgi:DNA-binding transcriptional LysR family regulator
MLDGVSLDQLRTFIAAVDEGSFSAAAGKLLRDKADWLRQHDWLAKPHQ